jgi:hypothetical protein
MTPNLDQPQNQIKRTLKLYSPHSGQLQVHQSKTRFNIVCFGRQSGKTTFGINKISDKAWKGPRQGVYWYILQTYDAAQVAFNRMFNFYLQAPEAFAKPPNKSDLSIQFRHGPTITYKSGKNYEDLRVETLDGVVIDEYRQQHPDLWPMVIRPMLAAKGGWADILSTPNGFEHFYDLFEKAKTDQEWSTFHAPSTVAPWWTEKEIESARSTMSEAEFAQEILAEFRDLTSGKAYLTFGDHNILPTSPFCRDGSLVHPSLPVVVGLDFNVSPMAWCLGQHRNGDFYFFDEIFLERSHTPEAAKELIYRLSNMRNSGLLKSYPQVLIAGDSTGSATKTSSAGQSDYDILQRMLTEAGFTWSNVTPTVNPHVKDRVNTVNSKCRAADGSVHLWVNPKCKYTIKDFQRVTWKEGANAILDQVKDKMLTHMSDAVGYPVCALAPITSSMPVGTLKVIYR